MEWVRAYQAATAVTLLAFLALMTVAVRQRIPGAVALYALWCGACAFLSFALAEAPEYRELFYRLGLRYVALAFVLFLGCEAIRLASGAMTRGEMVGAGGLVAAFLCSSLVGECMRPSGARMWAQAAAVVVPVLLAAALLAAGPMERRELAPMAHLVGLPVPAAVLARVRR